VKKNFIILFCLILVSCATPKVVEITRPDDGLKNCEELESLVADTQKFKRDALFEKDNTGGNMARAILFWPAMATSYYNADKAIRASNDRTYHLLKIMRKKGCPNIDLVNAEILRSSTETIVGQLHQLKEMYDKGDLTKEEYVKAKKKILN